MDPQLQQPPNTPPLDSPPTVVAPTDDRKHKKLMVIVAVVVLLVVIAGAALFSYHKNYSATNNVHKSYDPEEHKYESVVSITQDGFSPATLTIKPWTEVFFQNNVINPVEPDEAAGPRTVAQSKAATQEQYFSTTQILNKSGYGHTFINPGTYQFYDTQAPTHSLTIIVSKN